MSDFMDVSGGYGSQTTEIYLKRVLVGNVESVSAHLSVALEQLGYDVIEEEPALRARRGAQGWGTWWGSADILDYATTLVIRLKPIGAHSTRATFDYTIMHPWLSKGEKEVLTREAEAITALATVHAADKVCAACGTEAMDDSRFCRRCGAPMVSGQAELEVLRLAAEARAGHTSVVTSAMLSLASIATAIFAWIAVAATGPLDPTAVWVLIGVVGMIGLLNFSVGWCAWGRLNRALKPKREEKRLTGIGDVSALPGDKDAALPPRRVGMSVTEGTTELLNTPQRELQSVRIKRGNNTGEIR